MISALPTPPLNPPNQGRMVGPWGDTTVRTGFGIPTLNIYGLLAMAFVLVGTGVLLYRKPQQA